MANMPCIQIRGWLCIVIGSLAFLIAESSPCVCYRQWTLGWNCFFVRGNILNWHITVADECDLFLQCFQWPRKHLDSNIHSRAR